MPKIVNWVGVFASEDDAHYWANASKREKVLSLQSFLREKNEGFLVSTINTTIDRVKKC